MPVKVVFVVADREGDWITSSMPHLPRVGDYVYVATTMYQVKGVTWMWNGEQGLFDHVRVTVVRY